MMVFAKRTKKSTLNRTLHQFHIDLSMYIYIIYILYICVCLCDCVCAVTNLYYIYKCPTITNPIYVQHSINDLFIYIYMNYFILIYSPTQEIKSTTIAHILNNIFSVNFLLCLYKFGDIFYH